jgi:PAS domain S-box-containing protein
MVELLQKLFVSGFLPHGYCLFWTPSLLWLHVVSDVLITLAYYSIPVALVYFVRKRKDLAFDWMFLMFSAFIFACGTTHLMGVWTLWVPSYWLEGIIKLGTAMLSVATAGLLWPLIPQALALRSPAALERLNHELAQEVRARRQAEAWFRGLLEAAPDAMVLVNTDGMVILVNSQAEHLFGYPRPELLGQGIELFVPGWCRSQHLLPRACSEADPRVCPMGAELDLYGVRKDGQEFPVEISLSPLETPEGLLIVSTIRDVTERKRAEAALRESEQRYRDLFENTQEGIFRSTPVGGFTHVNPALVHMLGYASAEEVLALTLPDDLYVDPSQRTRLRASYEALGTLAGVELLWKKNDGAPIHVSLYARTVHDNEGNLIAYEGMVLDITERKQAEEALRRSERLYRTLARNFPNGAVVLFDQDLRYTLADGRGLAAVGLSKEAMEGKTIWEVFPPETCALMEPGYRAALAGHATISEVPYGGHIYLTHTLPVRDGHADIAGGMSVTQDVTERKRTEDALQQSEQHFRSLIENFLDLVTILNDDGTIRYESPSIKQVLGYEPEEVMGKDVFAFVHPDDAPTVRDHLARAIGGLDSARSIEFRCRHRDGSWRIFEAVGKVLLDDPIIAGVLINSRDISERKQLEAQLALARRLEAIGQLAAGVAHEINTPLQYVGDNIRFLQDAFRAVHEVLQNHARLLEASKASPVTPVLLTQAHAAVARADVASLVQEIPIAIEDSLHGVARVSKIVRAMKEFSHPGTTRCSSTSS